MNSGAESGTYAHFSTSSTIFASLTLFARVALAASFLSAVADRFGLWGAPGSPGVAWGDFQSFAGYTGLLLPFVPDATLVFFAGAATVAEIGLALLLIAGLRTRPAAAASGILLILFALAMIGAHGVKSPLDYSVVSASSAAMLVAMVGGGPWSVDRALEERRSSFRSSVRT
jgi:uncharacterized membrane protein YphA (DoxX/SURF4 family)